MENFMLGDTIHIYHIHHLEDSKGFFTEFNTWNENDNLNATVSMICHKNNKYFIDVGYDYPYKAVSGCRIVLFEKKIKF